MLLNLWLAGKGIASDLLGMRSRKIADLKPNLSAAIDWLCRAQDVNPEDGGVAAGFHLKDGWLPSYPETTGYIADTFFDLISDGHVELHPRVWKMIDWLLSLQYDDGGFPGQFGTRTQGPIIFNTGQILFGLVRAAEVDRDHGNVRAAAHDAGRWLASVMDDDGCWRQFTHNGVPHVYNARVAWAMLRCYELTGDSAIRNAAAKNVKWVLGQAYPDGYFNHLAFNEHEAPFLHTIAYAIRGLLECGGLLNDPNAIEVARTGANALADLMLETGRLAGTYGPDWKPVDGYHCLTGEAQIAIVWSKLAEITGDDKYRKAARNAVEAVASTQELRGSDTVRGAIAGSCPLWGKYSRFEYPNWATKFFIDAIRCVDPDASISIATEKEASCASAHC